MQVNGRRRRGDATAPATRTEQNEQALLERIQTGEKGLFNKCAKNSGHYPLPCPLLLTKDLQVTLNLTSSEM